MLSNLIYNFSLSFLAGLLERTTETGIYTGITYYNKSDPDVMNIKDVNNIISKESPIDTPVDVNNNTDRGSEILESQQSHKMIEISEPHFLTLFLSCFGCLQRRKC